MLLDIDSLLADLLSWYFRVNPRIRSRLTHEQYTFALRDFGEALRRPPVVADLTEEALADMRSLLLSRHLAPKTINERIGRITALWRFLAMRGMVARHPPTHRLTEPRRIPQAWSMDEMARVLAAVSAARGSLDGIPERLWWRSLILAMWDSGERITALMQAQWGDVDLTGGYLRVPAEHRKGRRTDRLYRIAIDTIASLRAIGQPPRELVWPWPLHPTYLWTRYGALLKKAGLPHDARSKFHRIRRSVASYVEAGGMNATDFLGHSSRSVTLRYLDPRIVGEKHAIDVLFRPVPH